MVASWAASPRDLQPRTEQTHFVRQCPARWTVPRLFKFSRYSVTFDSEALAAPSCGSHTDHPRAGPRTITTCPFLAAPRTRSEIDSKIGGPHTAYSKF